MCVCVGGGHRWNSEPCCVMMLGDLAALVQGRPNLLLQLAARHHPPGPIGTRCTPSLGFAKAACDCRGGQVRGRGRLELQMLWRDGLPRLGRSLGRVGQGGSSFGIAWRKLCRGQCLAACGQATSHRRSATVPRPSRWRGEAKQSPCSYAGALALGLSHMLPTRSLPHEQGDCKESWEFFSRTFSPASKAKL